MKVEPLTHAPILIVDDDEIVRRSMKRMLRSVGFENVRLASNSREALEEVQGGELELVLLDLHLGAESGMRLLIDLHRADPNLSVVVVTAQDRLDLLVRCMEVGAVDCVLKPVRPTLLIDTVLQNLEASRRRRRIGLSHRSSTEALPLVE